MMIVRYHTIYKIDICLDKYKKCIFSESRVYDEIIFRKYTKRTALKRMMHELKENDVIVVNSLAELGNTMTDLLNTLSGIMNRSIFLRIEDIKVSTENHVTFGDFVIYIFDAINKKNKKLIQEEKDIQFFNKMYKSRKLMDVNYILLYNAINSYVEGKRSVNSIVMEFNVSKSFVYYKASDLR